MKTTETKSIEVMRLEQQISADREYIKALEAQVRIAKDLLEVREIRLNQITSKLVC